MTLAGINARFREAGRLRPGERTSGGHPTSRKHWRLTTPSSALAREAAEAYGAPEPQRWTPPNGGAGGWEVLTTVDSLPVVVPPYGRSLTQSWEAWGGGGLVRRCDGRVQDSGERCACPAPEFRSQRRDACDPTTRLSVLLPDLTGLGVWVLSSKGYNAAAELGAIEGILARASEQGVWLRGWLRLEQRSSMVEGKRQDFVVPTLDFPLDVGRLIDSATSDLALGAGSEPDTLGEQARPALDAPAQPQEPAHEAQPPGSTERAPDDAPVTQAHLAAIHAACREHGIADEVRRRALTILYGDEVTSSADLTAGQARDFLRVFDDDDHDWLLWMKRQTAKRSVEQGDGEGGEW